MASRKPSLSVALIGAPHDGASEGEEHDGDSRDDAKEAMQALIDAVSAKDVDAALHAWEVLCDLDYAREDDGDEPEEG